MTISDFDIELNKIRAKNGWKIVLTLTGIWTISVYDKETGKYLASTGATGLAAVLTALRIPLYNLSVWSIDDTYEHCAWLMESKIHK